MLKAGAAFVCYVTSKMFLPEVVFPLISLRRRPSFQTDSKAPQSIWFLHLFKEMWHRILFFYETTFDFGGRLF